MELAPIKLLLVDDVQENLAALAESLRCDDWSIYTAGSGASALERLLESDFAVAIIDLHMSDMDGFQLAELMRSAERTQRIPIIFATAAHDGAGRPFKGYELGPVDYIYQPFDGNAVRSKVNAFAEVFRQRITLKQHTVALEQALAQQAKLLGQLQTTQQELDKAESMRDAFMSVVSHELRTPLNTFKLEFYARRFYLEHGRLEEFTPEKIARMIDTDERQLDRLLHLINAILDVSRIRAGQLAVRTARIDIVALIQEVAERFASQFEVAGCTLTLRSGAAVIGYCDEFRLEQVLANLFLNAMRHGAGKPIEIDVEEIAAGARFSVRDYGAGIAPDDQSRIFEQFESGGDKRKGGGLGLGLFIADQIVRAHGGWMCVSSELGSGAIFSVMLPRQKSTNEAV